jgi:predicted alpha/beta hydrolase family esterase
MSRTTAQAPRLLVIPGLRNSGPTHWQSWLQAQHRDARRVEQDDWAAPELERWAARVAETIAGDDGPWIAVAHSFGCLALAHHLQLRPDSPVRAALLVAPAEPDRFDVAERLPQRSLGRPRTVVASDNDPWMSAASSRRWATRWGSGWLTLGEAGHINVESGFGPLPLARRWVLAMGARLARERRPQHAAWAEWSFAV